VTDLTVLDNPIWHSLTTAHRKLSRRHGLACRYPKDVSPLAAMQSPSAQAYEDLRALVGADEGVGLFTAEPLDVPSDWQVARARLIDQMICTQLSAPAPAGAIPEIQTLQAADVPEMLALTAATEPGPFLVDTIRMGRYFGIRASDGRLIAMAGERLRLNDFVEISAVCTDPEFRGQGHARTLMTFLTAQILADGKAPILHVKSDNGAKLLYEQLGFRVRRAMHLSVLTLG